MDFIYDGNLGGCVAASEEYPNGDPLTWSPGIWNWLITNGCKTVFDVGCGVGHSTKYFKDHGCRVIAVEGSQKAIDQAVTDEIRQYDFCNGGFDPNEPIDVAWCCEVVEHIDSEHTDQLLGSLAKAKTVLMTHADPGQQGHHHVNCQKQSYWIAAMREHGMVLDTRQTQFLRSVALIEGGPKHHFTRSGLVFVHDSNSYPHMQTEKRVDAIFTWVSGEKFCQLPEFGVFLESLKRSGFTGKKVVFTHDMNIETRLVLEQENYQIIDVDPNRVEFIVRDRFLHFYEELQKFDEVDHYRNVLFVDSKDVVFQENPFPKLKEYMPDDYGDWGVLFSEGCRHKDLDWNQKDQANLQTRLRKFKRFSKDWDVINGGVQFGTATTMKNLAYNIWYSTLFVHGAGEDRSPCSEQAVLNYLYHACQNLDYTNLCLFTPQHFIAVAHGEAIARGVFEVNYSMQNGKLIHDKFNKPFLMFHQWERTQYRDAIMKEYRFNS